MNYYNETLYLLQFIVKEIVCFVNSFRICNISNMSPGRNSSSPKAEKNI